MRRDAFRLAVGVGGSDRAAREAGRLLAAVLARGNQAFWLAPGLQVVDQPGWHGDRLGFFALGDAGRVGAALPVDPFPARAGGLALAQAQAEHEADGGGNGRGTAAGAVDGIEPLHGHVERQDFARAFLRAEHGHIPWPAGQHALRNGPIRHQPHHAQPVVGRGRLARGQVFVAGQLDVACCDLADEQVAQVVQVQTIAGANAAHMGGARHRAAHQ